jgi:hypothetical protein
MRFLPGLLCVGALLSAAPSRAALPPTGNLSRTNLVAWCIVPFDSKKRGPEERAAMLANLGIQRLAYDWRAEHIPTFDAEVDAMRTRNIEISAWWFPAGLNAEARAILACIERKKIHPQLWITMGTEPEPDAARLQQKIDGAVSTLAPVCAEARRLGCTVALYNHLGWFGEPANQVEIIRRLRAAGHTNVGVVYNFHHAHDHIGDFAAQLEILKPHLLTLNLNGMTWEGDRKGSKIIPLGTGDEELELLRIVHASGWKGPIGIIGHTDEDAELKLRKELVGLEALAPLATVPPLPPRVRTASPRPVATRAGSLLPAPAKSAKVDGRFDHALDARVAGLVLDAPVDFRKSPFTIEAWVRIGSKDAFNIIAASEAKASASHWELYTFAGSGDLSFYAPGGSPDTVRSGTSIADGQWHHVAAQCAPGQVKLYVDGKVVADQKIRRLVQPDSIASRFAIGRLVEDGLGCDGWIDDVRISRGLRNIAALPTSPVHADESSLAHWNLDDVPQLLASAKPPANPPVGGTRPAPTDATPTTRAPGEPAVSGREPGSQGEADWVDNRWQAANVGNHLAATFRLADGSTVTRGLALRLGSGNTTGGVAYDLATASLRAAWSGGFVRFDPARFGLIGAPRPDGETALDLPKDSGWLGSTVRFQKLHVGQDGVVLEYTVNGTRFLETPALVPTPAGPVFTRTFAIAPHSDSILLPPHQGSVGSDRSDRSIPASTSTQLITLHLWRGPAERRAAFDAWSKAQAAPKDPLASLIPPTPEPTTHIAGQRGLDTDILAVDTLTFPYDNQSKALFFASGVDIAPDSTIYTCTIHGDVWRVTGVDASLKNLHWQRFATGLYQPLGLKVRNGDIFVLGRDHITRLHDRNADGVAEEYEAFFTGIQTSSGGHDYVTCLETDTAGRFYYVDPKGVHRVTADGSAMETLATGFRNPNGMGVRPDGRVITVAPQQGDWTPSSGIWEIREGLYGGWGGPRVTAQRTGGYDAPLCWIPHGVDNSSGSQAWIPDGQWGPLGGQMLHLLWGRCGMMLALRDTDASGTGVNGAVVPLPAKFLSGPNRATYNPADNSLLVAGSTGWQTSAVKDGAVQRVRFTGKPVALPIGWKAVPGGFEVRFSQPVDPATAQDPGSYSIKVWNYRYGQQYGSKDWFVSQPDKEGREDWSVKSATVQPDAHSVRLEIPGIRAVMQGELKYNVDTRAGGKPLRGSLWFTLNQVR